MGTQLANGRAAWAIIGPLLAGLIGVGSAAWLTAVHAGQSELREAHEEMREQQSEMRAHLAGFERDLAHLKETVGETREDVRRVRQILEGYERSRRARTE